MPDMTDSHGASAGRIVLQSLAKVLQPAALLTILATAALLAASIRTAPLGLPLGLMLLSWFARYSIAVLESLGSGERGIPVLSLEMIFGSMRAWRSFLVMLVMIALCFASGAAAYWLGPAGAIAIAIIAVLVMPMAVLTLGWTSDSAAALNPKAWLHFGRALGRSFIFLEAIGVLVVAASAALLSGAIHGNLILRIAVAMLGWLLLIVLAGVTIHARRDELVTVTQFYRGVETGPSPEELERRRQHALDDIYGLWRGGAKADAWQLVEKQLATASAPDQELRWLYVRMRTWEGQGLASRVAQELIHLDLVAGRTGYALKLARERLQADPAFRPRTGADTEQLAQFADQCSDATTAAELRGK
jgi:hypothetical protein